ncbi:ATP-binding protein [Phyllobacterium sp. YR531]|uniref:ATP-binding protein n=1 Tax=Phyllobacterium sp. YR531 TaxID=1144343 RepID=UPI00026F5249|nr:ATP-binding protein [Phyllobacterium sp. YR531]EJN04967.1 signal transduction histidine kinase [Phyllobacterium sp. YR531]
MSQSSNLDTIRGQIIALAIVPILIACAMDVVTEPLVSDDTIPYHRSTAIKIDTVVNQFLAAKTPETSNAILEATANSDIPVEKISAAEFNSAASDTEQTNDLGTRVRDALGNKFTMALESSNISGELRNTLLVKVNATDALAFSIRPEPKEFWLPETRFNSVLKGLLIVVPVILLAFYAGCMIVAPLSRFSAAALVLGADEGPDRPFEERGAQEVVALARALNDMRSRLRSMMNDRTRMLRAIGHDLRTPLTRLRLRVERSKEGALREAMLNDIATINGMMEETLTYLGKEVASEAALRSDLPSLLGTVCSDFADVGFNVSYSGPDRLAYSCKPRALSRAITNLVDNGTKFGTQVVVSLIPSPDGALVIEVSDDGPGLPVELQNTVFEPFFKASPARSTSGFGLGLSIVQDIIRGHGGSIYLRNKQTSGLIARISLPCDPAVADKKRALMTTKPGLLAMYKTVSDTSFL